jgi:hypothetical protein
MRRLIMRWREGLKENEECTTKEGKNEDKKTKVEYNMKRQNWNRK